MNQTQQPFGGMPLFMSHMNDNRTENTNTGNSASNNNFMSTTNNNNNNMAPTAKVPNNGVNSNVTRNINANNWHEGEGTTESDVSKQAE